MDGKAPKARGVASECTCTMDVRRRSSTATSSSLSLTSSIALQGSGFKVRDGVSLLVMVVVKLSVSPLLRNYVSILIKPLT